MKDYFLEDDLDYGLGQDIPYGKDSENDCDLFHSFFGLKDPITGDYKEDDQTDQLDCDTVPPAQMMPETEWSFDPPINRVPMSMDTDSEELRALTALQKMLINDHGINDDGFFFENHTWDYYSQIEPSFVWTREVYELLKSLKLKMPESRNDMLSFVHSATRMTDTLTATYPVCFSRMFQCQKDLRDYEKALERNVTFEITDTDIGTAKGLPLVNGHGEYCCNRSPLCAGLSFDRKLKWVKHMHKHDRPFECPEDGCRAVFATEHRMNKHYLRIHIQLEQPPAGTFFCPYPTCARGRMNGFKRKDSLNEHCRRLHELRSQELTSVTFSGNKNSGPFTAEIQRGVLLKLYTILGSPGFWRRVEDNEVIRELCAYVHGEIRDETDKRRGRTDNHANFWKLLDTLPYEDPKKRDEIVLQTVFDIVHYLSSKRTMNGLFDRESSSPPPGASQWAKIFYEMTSGTFDYIDSTIKMTTYEVGMIVVEAIKEMNIVLHEAMEHALISRFGRGDMEGALRILFSIADIIKPLCPNQRAKTETPSGPGRYEPEIQGILNGVSISSLPDMGAGANFISQTYASQHNLDINPLTARTIQTANGKRLHTLGTVKLPFSFQSELQTHTLDFHVLKDCVRDVILGAPFLRVTKTFTHFAHRVGRKLRSALSHRVQYLASSQPRMRGQLNGEAVDALPDTGSDIMLMSRRYALEHGYTIDTSPAHKMRLEFADGSIDHTSGFISGLEWTYGDEPSAEKHICDFYILSDLPCDVLLSYDFLERTKAFTEQQHWLFDPELTFSTALSTCFEDEGVEDDFWALYTITSSPTVSDLLGKFKLRKRPKQNAVLDAASSARDTWEREQRRLLQSKDETEARIARLPEDGRGEALRDFREVWARDWGALMAARPEEGARRVGVVRA